MFRCCLGSLLWRQCGWCERNRNRKWGLSTYIWIYTLVHDRNKHLWVKQRSEGTGKGWVTADTKIGGRNVRRPPFYLPSCSIYASGHHPDRMSLLYSMDRYVTAIVWHTSVGFQFPCLFLSKCPNATSIALSIEIMATEMNIYKWWFWRTKAY